MNKAMSVSSTEVPAAGAKRRRARWVALFVVAALAAYAASLHPFSRGEPWPEDLDRARAAAAASGRPLLIQFTSAGCPYCRRMEREVLSDRDVRQLLASFELVQVNGWARQDLAGRYGVQGTPAFVVVGPQDRFVGKVEGYLPADVFLDFLRHAARAAADSGAPSADAL